MTCKDCPDRKNNDAVRQMEDGVDWYCNKKHSECEDVVCLLRMIIWQLFNMESFDDEV